MPGGTFLAMNKVRPGAYMNFKSVPRPMMTVGDRGIATIPLELNWGAEGELIDVYSDELLSGDSLAKIGFTAFDEESKIVNLMLQNCYLAKIYRTNTGGQKATTTIGELTITAKHPGTFGNKIQVSVVEESTDLFTVSTFVNGAQKDSQKVAEVGELEANDFVVFSGAGNFIENAGKMLTGGTNGTATKATYYPAYLSLLSTARWQVLGCPDLGDDDVTLKANIVTFIKNQRNDEGRYVQSVVANYPVADFEGVISNTNGLIINNVTFTKEEMCAVVAAITAGASIVESNTNKVISGATSITNPLTNTQIIEALKNGQLVFSANQRGEIKIEQDINSYHTFTVDKNRVFSKNRVMRTLDEIGTSVKDTWEQTFMGKVDNNDDGRTIFKSNLNDYFIQLQNLNAIQNYLGVEEIDITQGIEIDDVVVGVHVQPTDSMEKLYMTVNVVG